MVTTQTIRIRRGIYHNNSTHFKYTTIPSQKGLQLGSKENYPTHRAKRPIHKVTQPCVLKLDNQKVDIYKWVNQARIYVEPLEEHRRVEMLLLLVDQTERTSLESRCLVYGPLYTDNHVNTY